MKAKRGRPGLRRPSSRHAAPAPLPEALLLENAQTIAGHEREIHLLRKNFYAYQTLMKRVHGLVLRFSVLGDVRAALAMAAQVLVEDFAYEFAVVLKGEEILSAGPEVVLKRSEACVRRHAADIRSRKDILVAEFTDGEAADSGVKWLLGGFLPPQKDVPATEDTVIIAGRTTRTATFYPLPDSEELRIFQDLLHEVSQALTGVQYREELTRERNSLKEAAGQLRKLLVESHAKEKEISDLHNRLSVTLEGMGNGVVTLDKAGTVLFANMAAGRLLGAVSGDAVDPVALERRLFAENGGLMRGWIARAEGGEVVREETSLADGSGTPLPVDVTFSRIQDSVGQPWGFVQVIRDLREIKKLRNSLQQADKLAAMGQMAAGIAHEINNPLAGILMFAELLKESPPGESVEDAVKNINEQVNRCITLVQDMLAFSRSSTTEDQAPMCVAAAVRQAMSLIAIRAKTSGVEIRQNAAPPLPQIRGNHSQIQQVIVNLASNAIDAMNGKGTLEIAAAASSRKPGTVELSVRDTGPGIAPEVVNRIFEPFFTTKAPGKGTGLGLSLVHDIVKRHGGEIQVDTALGRGTTFMVFFPSLGVDCEPTSKGRGL